MLLFALTACSDFGMDQHEVSIDGGARVTLEPTETVQFEPTSAFAAASSAELVIYSSGDAPLAVHDIFIGGVDADVFYLPDLPLPIMLEPGYEFPARIYFEPNAESTFSADVTVTTAGNLEEVDVSRRLIGNGCYDRGNDGTCDDY
ncbi:MAG: hypothetical protein GY884_21330 [Proteobacteria bacterium]|nr:hypothetical protein [Pseudomonadota bacterium]